ncbi:MAG: translocation/assembly module TamB domain-containing protein [Myxococcaceae bacterium]
MSISEASLTRKKTRRRRWVWLLVLLLPVVVGWLGLQWLRSAQGEALLKQQILSAAGDALQGKVELEHVTLDGDHLVLTGLKLFTPEGELVASIERVEADLDVAALASKRVHLSHVRIEQPALFLREDDRGWNLSRALAAKGEKKTDEKATPSSLKVVIDDAVLESGQLELHQPGRDVVLTALAAKANAKLGLGPLTIDGALTLDAKLDTPGALKGEKLVLEASASSKNGQGGHATLTLGQTGARVSLDASTQQAAIEKLTLSPRELSAFVPDWPLQQVVLGRGTLGLKAASLELSAGSARLVASARYDLDAHQVELFEVGASDVNLRELIGAAKNSSIAVKAKGRFDDWRTETLSGALTAEAKWTAGDLKLLDLDLDASAKTGALKVKQLHALGPGLELTARGTAAKDVNLFGTLQVKDLAQLDVVLRQFADVETGGLSGSGNVLVSAKGPLRRPAVSLIGQLDHLRVEDLEMDSLALNADLPDVTRPFDTDVLLHSQRLRYGERAFDEVTLDFLTRGRDVDLDFTTHGMGDLQAHVVAQLDKDNHGANVASCELKWTDTSWSMEAPTRITWGQVLEVQPFVMSSGDRRLSAHAKKTSRELDAEVHAQNLDLARLPSVLTPAAWDLGGTVTSLDLTAKGNPTAPEVKVALRVADGRALGAQHLQATADADWKEGRLAGKLALESDVGHLDGDFDLPLLALRDEKPEPARAHLVLESLSSEWLGKKLERSLPFTALLSGQLDLSGTGDHPQVKLRVEAPQLVFTPKPDAPFSAPVLDALKLELTTGADDTLTLVADTRAVGGSHHVQVHAPLTLSSLRRQAPTKDEWFAMPLDVEVESKDVSLPTLAALKKGEVDDELAGTATVTTSMKGSMLAPHGTVRLQLSHFTQPPVRDFGADLTLTAEQTRTRLEGKTSLAGRDAAEVRLVVMTPPETALRAFFAPEGDVDAVITALADVPQEGLVALAPWDLTDVLRRGDVKKEQVLPGGTATATLEIAGTLEAPNARLVGALTNLRFDKMALGSARFDVKVAPQEQTVNVALGGQGRDDLKLKGSTGVDVRLSALRRGLQWQSAPVELSVDSRNFDLAFLTGATDSLRLVAGRLDFEGHVNGKLGAPRFEGDGALTKGRLSLAGNGDYRDIECEVAASNDLFELRKLTLNSGAGHASFTARAERQPTGVFHVTSTGNTEKLPLVNDDQLLAALSIDFSVEGEASAEAVELSRVSIPHAEVRLPEVKRKDLQDLQRPKDIIVLRRGKKPTKRERNEARDAASQQQQRTGTVFSAVIDAQKNLWVKSSDVNVELGLSDGFRFERDSLGTRLQGEARIIQGTLEVIGREFTVQKGSAARFSGAPTQPYVNVTALHTNTKEDVKITVTVAGKGSDVSIKATSEPPLPESDIYAILATGRRSLKTSGGAAITPGQAASVVGQLAASQLKTALAKKIPIDVFNFETSDNFEKVRVDVGKYIGDSLYLGATVNIGARRDRGENTWAGRLEWQVSRSVTLEAYAGDALSFGADAVWSSDY